MNSRPVLPPVVTPVSALGVGALGRGLDLGVRPDVVGAVAYAGLDCLASSGCIAEEEEEERTGKASVLLSLDVTA